MTCIPYSRNRKRGPKVQAALGRAMAGMGYPSTWKDVLDDSGERIPKKNKDGEIIDNKDGSIRYQQEPDKQGIIDWIEDQKKWLQKEMMRRYGWDREYKGSHPRGNLSTPDYRVARSKERLKECNQIFSASLQHYQNRVRELTMQLDNVVDRQWEHATNRDIIERYMQVCTDEAYNILVDTAAEYLDRLAVQEQEKLHLALDAQIHAAKHNQNATNKKEKRTLYKW